MADKEKPKAKSVQLDYPRYERLEAEARRRRKDTGDSVEYMDILRELIDEHL